MEVEYPAFKTKRIIPWDIDYFHKWLMNHPRFRHMSERILNLTLFAFRNADYIHAHDRRHDGSPYIVHPIETICEYTDTEGYIDPETPSVLINHDILEEHPEAWWQLLECIGLRLFWEVLVLSTGWFKKMGYRQKMIDFFLPQLMELEDKRAEYLKYSDFIKDYPDYEPLLEIVRILNPVNPFHKAYLDSLYALNLDSQEIQLVIGAFSLYLDKKILPKYKSKGKTFTEEDEEFIGLWNYLYFWKETARRKLMDMLKNMGDMEEMEKIKPGYVQTRRIKAYILWVTFKSLGMTSEYARLVQEFDKYRLLMITDAEVQEQYRKSTIYDVNWISYRNENEGK